MANLNFETYFENSDNQYYKPNYMIKILETILANKLDDIRNAVVNAQITVTKEQVEKFIADLCTEKYFVEQSLKYFIRYSAIVRKKALLLLDIIEKIGNKETASIQELLIELDIQLDENGNILREDIIRLIPPTVYNINKLSETIIRANTLSSYLTFKMSEQSLHKCNLIEGELYPLESLQLNYLHYGVIDGYVALSPNQRKKYEQRQRIRINSCSKLIKIG